MTPNILAETTAPTLTVTLTEVQVDALIFALAYYPGWALEKSPEQVAGRFELLRCLMAWVTAEMTTEEILARES